MVTAAIALLLSLNLLFYLDDLLLEGTLLFRRRQPRRLPPASSLPEKRLALLVPFFKGTDELLALQYQNHTLFLGVRADDASAWGRARALEQAHAHVIVLVQPSERDRRSAWRELAAQVLRSERLTGITYDAFVLLEGSDSLHPAALRVVNEELEAAALVQLPLLPRPSSWLRWGSGAYADEASDLQRELLARSTLGGALATRGTGTALSRRLLLELAEHAPESLAHSYALGVHARRLGFSARLALAVAGGELVGVHQEAPESVRWAIRRRARFAFESSIDAARDFGWGRDWQELYFFWRDRRWLFFSLAGFALSLFLLGLSFTQGENPEPLPLWIGFLSLVNLALAATRIALRIRNCRTAYGWRRALLLPLRHPVGNFVQSVAQWRALAEAWRGLKRP